MFSMEGASEGWAWLLALALLTAHIILLCKKNILTTPTHLTFDLTSCHVMKQLQNLSSK